MLTPAPSASAAFATTEYATGVDFIDQLKLSVSYMGIVDLD